jgi:hypothetical protein
LIAVVDATLKKSFQFGVDSYYLVTPDGKRLAFKRSQLDRVKQQGTTQVARLQAMVAEMTRLQAKLSEAGKARKAALTQQAQEAENTLKQLTRMLERAEEIEKAGGLLATLYIEVGDYRVVLLESKSEQ